MIIYGFARKEQVYDSTVEQGGFCRGWYEVEKDLIYLGFYSTKELAQKRLDSMVKAKPYIKEYKLYDK